MPTYPLIQCEVALGGGALSVVPKRGHDRVTPAELALIQKVHSSENIDAPIITNAMWTGDVEMDEGDLRQDLARKFGGKMVQMMFPGPLPTTTDAPDKREWYAERLRAVEAGEPLNDEPEQPAEEVIETGSKKALQKSYELLVGKKPFNGWDEAELRRRIAAASTEPQAA